MTLKTNFIALLFIAQTTTIFGQLTPHSVDSSLLPLALSITRNVQGDSEKVVAICQWILTNLDYDFESIKNERNGHPDPDSFQKSAIVIRRKKAVCDGYSQVFRDFCLLNNIFSSAVVGYTAYNELTDSAQVLHAWNSVRVNNRWYLMDLTWEDIALDFDKNRLAILRDSNKRNKLSPRERLLIQLMKRSNLRLADKQKMQQNDVEKIATNSLLNAVDSANLNGQNLSNNTINSPIFSLPASTYLFTPPHVFRTDHLPKDPLWQLTDSVISLQKFFFQNDPSVSPYFSTHFDYKNRLNDLENLDYLERERRELSRQWQFNSRDWMVVQNIAYDYTNRVHSAFKTFNSKANSGETPLIDLQNILTNTALYLTQAEGFHRLAGKISTGYAATNMVENLAACEAYRQHIEQLWEWLKKVKSD